MHEREQIYICNFKAFCNLSYIISGFTVFFNGALMVFYKNNSFLFGTDETFDILLPWALKSFQSLKQQKCILHTHTQSAHTSAPSIS